MRRILLGIFMISFIGGVHGAAILKRGSNAEVETLDIARASSMQADRLLRDLYEGLVSVNESEEVEPGIAEKWTVSEDGLTYTFNLRPSKWSNGDALTAHDFEASWKRGVNPMVAGTLSHLLNPVKNASKILKGEMGPDTLGVKALDDLTLQVVLDQPTPYFLSLLDNMVYYPLHRASLEKHGDDYVKKMPFVSNGAFILKDRVPQEKVVLIKNKRYHQANTVKLDAVHYYPMSDKELELKKFEVGDLHVTSGVPGNKVAFLKKKFKDQLKVYPHALPYSYGFNTTKAPFNDMRLRKALSLVIDRNAIVRLVGGGELPLYSWVVPGTKDYTPASIDYRHMSMGERIQAAKKLYGEAGYSKESPLTVKFHYNVDDTHKRIAIAAADMWKKALGVKTELVAQEFAITFNAIKQKEDTQVFRNFAGIFYNDPHAYLTFFTKDTGYDSTGYKSDDYDAVLKEASLAQHKVPRNNFYRQAEKMLLDQHAIIPIYQRVSTVLVKPSVSGYKPNLFDRHLSRRIALKG